MYNFSSVTNPLPVTWRERNKYRNIRKILQPMLFKSTKNSQRAKKMALPLVKKKYRH
jgi:hypothetical protein